MSVINRPDDFYLAFNAMAERMKALERIVQGQSLITDGIFPENPYDGQQILMSYGTGGFIKRMRYREEYGWEQLGIVSELLTSFTNGGAEVASPNNSTKTYLKKSDDTNVSITVTQGATTETWLVESWMTIRADSANDTLAYVISERKNNSTSALSEISRSYAQRLYYGTGALAGWTTVHVRGITSLTSANTSFTFQAASIFNTGFGGAYSRAANDGGIIARRIA